MNLKIDKNLKEDTQIYRCISFEAFVAFIESGQTYVSRVSCWPDTWEAILMRVPIEGPEGERSRSIHVGYSDLFGQCWSLLPESDALWRIYSPQKIGVIISSTVHQFELIQDLGLCFVGKVIYSDDIPDLVEKSNSAPQSPFRDALFKRLAFKHEEEVRLLANLSQLPVDYSFTGTRVNLGLDPLSFINSITLDPRADGWFSDAINRYCKRAGFTFEPIKSSLYGPDPHLNIGVTRRWVPVGEKK